MTKTVLAAIDSLQALVGAIDGIRSAPADPPESAMQYPFAITYLREGEVLFQATAWTTGLHRLIVEIHFNRVSLAKGIRQALPFYEAFLDIIQNNPTLGGTCDSVGKFTYQFGLLEYAGTTTIGYQFTVDVKINTPEG